MSSSRYEYHCHVVVIAKLDWKMKKKLIRNVHENILKYNKNSYSGQAALTNSKAVFRTSGRSHRGGTHKLICNIKETLKTLEKKL